jgi:hypothetical protein
MMPVPLVRAIELAVCLKMMPVLHSEVIGLMAPQEMMLAPSAWKEMLPAGCSHTPEEELVWIVWKVKVQELSRPTWPARTHLSQ